MTSERWRQVEALYYSASELDPSQRSAFLDGACRGDEELRRQVESLLDTGSSEHIIDHPAWEALADSGNTRTSLREGVQLGIYRTEARLGAGGMGEVFRAVDTRLDRRVAIKVCAARFSERFDREARALAALSHPHICTLFDVGPDYLVMELLDGGTLTGQIAQGPLPPADVLRFGWQIADALAEAHGAGIVHRDLKPGNIMLTRHGVKVLDFGLAKVALAEDQKLTQTGALMGTPAYMAPEQMEGKEADARCDLFALGLILYEMASGQLPFPGASLGSMLITGSVVTVPPLSRLRSGLPAGLDAMITRLLEPDPAKRLQSAAEVRDQLQTLASNPKRNFKALIGVAVLLLLLLAAGTLWVLRRADKNFAMPGPVTQITPVTSYLGDEREPSLSPDGKQVAFSWNGEKGDNRDIYVKQIGGQTPLRLTQDTAEDNYPAWSPDGSQIAFLSQRDADHWTIEVVSSLGGPERKLYQVGLNTTFLRGAHPLLAWSPDGKQIVFTQASKGTVGRLYVLSLETGLARRLQLGSVHDSLYDSSPSISPDGRWLAFTRSSGPANGTFMVQRLGPGIEPSGNPTPVPDSGPDASSPCWSPDSKRLVFADRRRIFAWEVGGSVRPIYTASGVLGGLTASWRSGRLRAIAASRSDTSYIWALPIDPVSHAVSGPAVPRVRSAAGNDSPRLSPDGRTLAFISGRSGFDELWLADADGKNQRQLTHFLDAYIVGYARWSPDGKQIAFHARLPEVPQVYVVDTEGGAPRKVTSAAFGFFGAIWAIDGKHLFATGKADGKDEIFRVGVADGQTERLFEGTESAPTPDGKRILYAKVTEPGLFSRALEGDPSRNPEERLVDDFIVLFGGMWPVPSGIYYTGVTLQGKLRAFRFFDYATHRSKDIAPSPSGVAGGITLSPDQHELLYSTTNDSSGDDLLLLEFQ
jgi:eukaryotic-like serine/threonine-protein kinase